MISDPELEGGWEADRAARPAERLAPHGPEAEGWEADGPGVRRPWLWALGGAVVASAVWAGGLFALGDRLAAPEVAYRATKNLCQDFEARALSRIGGDLHGYRPVNKESEHPAVRGAICNLQNGEIVSTLTVRVQVDLHRKTDPAAEFDAPPLGLVAAIGEGRNEAVQGLGERAVFFSAPGETLVRLKVLDGGAVFTIEAYTTVDRSNAPADGAELQAAMIEDARALLAALKE
ncbi:MULTISPECIES: hypothetical protein [unclassified Streptomyces]|uniref:hypothetical protein n=1 Tax=unclassified Streptomyces TaxID=2593676 RepID=UPI00044F555B|nr:hypothetical protein [Streptomyces sp. PCS3-D2]WKV72106.1 hypothetical protein AW27_011630 [Streptomyces sp. PCS3-D2]